MTRRPDDPTTVEDLKNKARGDWVACPNCMVASPAEVWFDRYIARSGGYRTLAKDVDAVCYECGFNRLAVFPDFPFEGTDALPRR